MSANVIHIHRGNPEELGGCPTCGGNDGYVNVDPDSRFRLGVERWFFCRKHRFKWSDGLRYCQDETTAVEKERNEAFLSAYIHVAGCRQCGGCALFRHACSRAGAAS